MIESLIEKADFINFDHPQIVHLQMCVPDCVDTLARLGLSHLPEIAQKSAREIRLHYVVARTDWVSCTFEMADSNLSSRAVEISNHWNGRPENGSFSSSSLSSS